MPAYEVCHRCLCLFHYFIWTERNLRAFQGKATPVDHVTLKLVKYIRDFLSTRRVVKPSPE